MFLYFLTFYRILFAHFSSLLQVFLCVDLLLLLLIMSFKLPCLGLLVGCVVKVFLLGLAGKDVVADEGLGGHDLCLGFRFRLRSSQAPHMAGVIILRLRYPKYYHFRLYGLNLYHFLSVPPVELLLVDQPLLALQLLILDLLEQFVFLVLYTLVY